MLLNAHNSSESLGQRCGDPEAAMKAQPLVCLLALMQVACFGNIDALRSKCFLGTPYIMGILVLLI